MDVLRIVHELVDQGLDRGGDRGREQRRLPVIGTAAQNSAHVGVEADVEHPVGLVEHGHADVVEAQSAALEVVDHSAGGADDDLGPALEVGEVVGEPASAHQYRGLKPSRAGEEIEHRADLLGEFARGREDDGLAFAEVRIADFDSRQSERDGLAGARLGLPDDVASVHHQRDGLCLDRGGLFELERGQRREHSLRQAEGREGRRPVIGRDLIEFIQRGELVAAREQGLLRGALGRGRTSAGRALAAVSPALSRSARAVGLG